MIKHNTHEIKIDQIIFRSKIAELKKLLEGTGYSRSDEFLTRGYGQTHSAINQLVHELNAIEDNLIELIRMTIAALESGSLKFNESDAHASSIISGIDGSTVHVSDSGEVHGGGGQIESSVDSNSEAVPSLQHNMDNPINQFDEQYAATFTQPYGYNAGCCATAYATGLSIVNGCGYNPTDYWYGGATHYEPNTLSEYSHGFDAQTIYNSLLNGKPVMCHFGHTLDGGQHWVLITGVNEGADVNNLTYNDFKAIDPAKGTERSFEDLEQSYPGMNLWGYHLFL